MKISIDEFDIQDGLYGLCAQEVGISVKRLVEKWALSHGAGNVTNAHVDVSMCPYASKTEYTLWFDSSAWTGRKL